MTLDEVYRLWRVEKKREVRESTYWTYEFLWRNRISPVLGGMEVAELRRQHVQAFVDDLLQKKSLKSTRDTIIVLKMVVRYAAEELDVNVSTTWKLRYPKRDADSAPHRPVVYSRAEFRKIVETCKENPSPTALGIMLAICTGMRIGEVCALRFEDIDVNARTVSVQRTIERIYFQDEDGTFRSKLIVNPPKSASSRRQIPILSSIMPLVRKFHALARPDYYVCTMKERPIEPRSFRNRFYGFIQNRCGLRTIKFHGLRHTFATMMINGKNDVKTVSELLGHADVVTTLSVYVHPSEETKRKSVNSTLNRLLK